jgi:hypothetical protein
MTMASQRLKTKGPLLYFSYHHNIVPSKPFCHEPKYRKERDRIRLKSRLGVEEVKINFKKE